MRFTSNDLVPPGRTVQRRETGRCSMENSQVTKRENPFLAIAVLTLLFSGVVAAQYVIVSSAPHVFPTTMSS